MSSGEQLIRILPLGVGCDSAQGYYLSPPLAPEEFIGWLDGALPRRGEEHVASPEALPFFIACNSVG